MAEEDDPVVHEVGVFLSKSLATNLYVLQYPLRPAYMPYDNVEHLAARVKTDHKMVEVELGLNTQSHNYSQSRGEMFANMVDGKQPSSTDGPYFASGMMDKQVLRSQPCAINTQKYAIGILKNDELHLTPVHAMVQMHPVFDYLNKADAREKAVSAAKETTGGDTSQDEDDEAQAVTVTAKFARPESIEAKARREASYEHYQKMLHDEPWRPLKYFGFSAESRLQPERQMMYGTQRGSDRHEQFHSTANQYLDMLLPRPDTDEQFKPPTSDNIFSRQKLKTMPLADAVRALLLSVKVIQYSKLMELLPEGTDPQVALRLLQQVAVMVQGCWVVKSDLLYPKGSCSPHSGVSAEHLIRGRDFVMWKFTHHKYVQRKEIAPKLPSEDVKDILEQMSRLRPSRGWEFVFDYDTEFVERHPDVVTRQRMLWEAKWESLSKTIKNLPKDADKKAKEGEQLLMKQNEEHRPRRRRASSKSSPRKRTLSGRSTSDLSDLDMEVDGAGDSLSGTSENAAVTPMEVCGSAPNADRVRDTAGANHTGTNGQVDIAENGLTGSVELLKLELEAFAREVFAKIPVIKFPDLKREFIIKLSQLRPGHILSTGVSDRKLVEALLSVGGFHINKQVNQSLQESIYVFRQQGNKHDKAREILLSMLEPSCKVKSTAFISAVKEKFGDQFSEAELKKILKDICESRGSKWVVKGLGSGS